MNSTDKTILKLFDIYRKYGDYSTPEEKKNFEKKVDDVAYPAILKALKEKKNKKKNKK